MCHAYPIMSYYTNLHKISHTQQLKAITSLRTFIKYHEQPTYQSLQLMMFKLLKHL